LPIITSLRKVYYMCKNIDLIKLFPLKSKDPYNVSAPLVMVSI
jgi:hypothetical protein